MTDKIIRELEQGRVPWVQPWLGSAAGVAAPLGLPKNAATGRPYSGINILILGAPSPSAALPARAGSPSARR